MDIQSSLITRNSKFFAATNIWLVFYNLSRFSATETTFTVCSVKRERTKRGRTRYEIFVTCPNVLGEIHYDHLSRFASGHQSFCRRQKYFVASIARASRIPAARRGERFDGADKCHGSPRIR